MFEEVLLKLNKFYINIWNNLKNVLIINFSI